MQGVAWLPACWASCPGRLGWLWACVCRSCGPHCQGVIAEAVSAAWQSDARHSWQWLQLAGRNFIRHAMLGSAQVPLPGRCPGTLVDNHCLSQE